MPSDMNTSPQNDTQRELELVVAGGVSPADAIVIATRNSARFLGKLDDLGTIEVGKLADLVVLENNLFEIAPDQIHKTKVAMTVMNGQVRHE